MQVQIHPLKPGIRIRKREPTMRTHRRATVDFLHALGTFHLGPPAACSIQLGSSKRKFRKGERDRPRRTGRVAPVCRWRKFRTPDLAVVLAVLEMIPCCRMAAGNMPAPRWPGHVARSLAPRFGITLTTPTAVEPPTSKSLISQSSATLALTRGQVF